MHIKYAWQLVLPILLDQFQLAVMSPIAFVYKMQVMIELSYKEKVSMTVHDDKVRLVVECSLDERTYIKMLATNAHMTMSEFVLSYLKPLFPRRKDREDERKKPNKKTLAAHKEALEGKGTAYESMDDFWKDMGVEPRAKS